MAAKKQKRPLPPPFGHYHSTAHLWKLQPKGSQKQQASATVLPSDGMRRELYIKKAEPLVLIINTNLQLYN